MAVQIEAKLYRSFAFETALGWMAVGMTRSESTVCCLTLGHPSRAAALAVIDAAPDLSFEIGTPDAGLVDRLRAYAQGEPDDFRDVAVVCHARTPFQTDVLEACRRIPYGRTRTYAQLAAEAGRPRAARAVGNGMAANRIPLIIPCHRVVASDGRLGGYSAAGGVDLKRRLLRLESASSLLK